MLAAVVISCLSTVSAQTGTTGTAASARPNIILILADDMDYADVGLYGGRLTPTPNIDSIAKNGMEFTNAYVSCPVCGPSRVGILTGRYQDRIGYVTNHGPKIPENFGLPTTATIVSETLNQAGYKTGMSGKWHLGFKPDMVPNARGFDFFFGHLHGAHDYMPGVQKPGPILRNNEPVTTTKYLTTEIGDEAVKFIKDAGADPYFLYVPFNAPHSPLQAPEETLKKFAHHKDEYDQVMAAMVYEMDQSIGDILAAVRESGEEENTLIVFFNDNGGARSNRPEANGELRAGKMTLWEGGIRVPLFIQWKGKVPAGSKYERPVIGLDLAPTFVAAANVEAPLDYEGVNLLPHMLGEKADTPHETLYWRWIDAPNQKAVRQGDWKAIQPEDDAAWELYNLADDIGETKNLAAEHPEIVKELKQKWNKWNKDNSPPLFMDVRVLNRRAQLAAEKSAKAADGTSTEPKKRKQGRKARRQNNKANNAQQQ
jgi:arylsulfatase A-like enzyme